MANILDICLYRCKIRYRYHESVTHKYEQVQRTERGEKDYTCGVLSKLSIEIK